MNTNHSPALPPSSPYNAFNPMLIHPVPQTIVPRSEGLSEGKTCDFCTKPIVGQSWKLIVPRPSDPTELVCTMEGCAACGAEHSLSSPHDQDHMVDAVEEGKLTINGHRILFYSF